MPDGEEAAQVVSLRRHLNEVEASAELLACIVSNLWDFERITNPNKQQKYMTEPVRHRAANRDMEL